MRHLLFFMTGVLALDTLPIQAQTATDSNEGVRVTADATTSAQVLSWWGRSTRTYFVQQSFDLINWTYLPHVETGTDTVTGLNFTCSDNRQFWRLKHVTAAGGTAGAADADSDGVSNADELNVYHTDPLNPDSDADGFSDGTEVLAGTDAKSAASNPETDLFDLPLIKVAFLLSNPTTSYYSANSGVLQSEYSASDWLVTESSNIPGNVYASSYVVTGGMPSVPALPARPDADSIASTWSSYSLAGSSQTVSLLRLVNADTSGTGFFTATPVIGRSSWLTGTAAKYKLTVRFPSRNARTVKVVEQRARQPVVYDPATSGYQVSGGATVTDSQIRTLTLPANATDTDTTVLQPDEADNNFMTTAKVGPPVETLQPNLAPYPLADPLVVQKQVRICRWRDAFGPNYQTFDPNFIGTDPDRVVFRLPQSEVDPALPQLRVSVAGIQGVSGQTSDTGVLALQLNNGMWESLPLIFVADPEDDQSFNGQAGLGATNDGSVKTPNPDNDQTRLASFGATVSVGYRKPGQTADTQVQVATIAPARRTVKVKLHRLSQTGAASLNNGNEATIQAHFDFVRLIYRQIGIDVVQNGAIINQAYPADIWALVNSQDRTLDGSQKTPANAAHPNMTMFDYLDSLSGSDTDINLYWIDDIWTYTASSQESGDAATSGEAELNGNTALLTLIASEYGRKTAGHELGHCLGLGHPPPANDSDFRLMHSVALSWHFDHLSAKRFYFLESLFPNQ